MLQEYEDCKVHVDDLLQRVKEQMGLLELVKSATGRGSNNGTPSGKGGQGNRINKLPKFPIFSGEDPVPRDECSIDTFLFQIKGARKDITDRAVRTALLSFLRGGGGCGRVCRIYIRKDTQLSNRKTLCEYRVKTIIHMRLLSHSMLSL